MQVNVNGEQREFAEGSTLTTVLEALGRTHRGVAVALNGELVRRGRWDEVVVPDGARLEVLTAVQGG
ncbi:sulfur carrier protein ThiS [Amycolatopsis cihanbeyliensis]|uniref:Sulfur carrier protein n=1 Tax=Amycolatopsis cihanbeyliensis TaxID=1128664 RepID=A0A542DIP2_AMYCI|nr:sulfur carrier protein ThiS [Amycolatopsis cihanbeyliensis]TQJ02971.1 sulfur carrier protein [Amycolatopsis cihanbeyliensis]